ncbi:hypothetical protein K1719_021427 [Acacia pycnantha]|nr:hypothetical protein K1719_021427 [Acacia pycnantha]
MVSLRRLWRKMKKQKKRFSRGSSPTILNNVRYDIDSYSQNFDDGYSSDLSRSFSARFANPFSKAGEVVVLNDEDNSSEMSC